VVWYGWLIFVPFLIKVDDGPQNPLTEFRRQLGSYLFPFSSLIPSIPYPPIPKVQD